MPHFETLNATDLHIDEHGPLIIDSGGQYLDGTTKVTRTIHLGEPSNEQKTAYTNVLRGIIRLSTLVFPENLKPSEVDALTRYMLLILFITRNIFSNNANLNTKS